MSIRNKALLTAQVAVAGVGIAGSFAIIVATMPARIVTTFGDVALEKLTSFSGTSINWLEAQKEEEAIVGEVF